jgi:hypothetical protein
VQLTVVVPRLKDAPLEGVQVVETGGVAATMPGGANVIAIGAPVADSIDCGAGQVIWNGCGGVVGPAGDFDEPPQLAANVPAAMADQSNCLGISVVFRGWP